MTQVRMHTVGTYSRANAWLVRRCDNSVGHINKVKEHRARLVLGLVTTFGVWLCRSATHHVITWRLLIRCGRSTGVEQSAVTTSSSSFHEHFQMPTENTSLCPRFLAVLAFAHRLGSLVVFCALTSQKSRLFHLI